MRDSKIIKYLSNCLINNILNGFRLMIKRRHRRKDVGAHVSSHGHKPQMSFVEWRFSYHKNQFSLFLQGHIRRSYEEIVVIWVGNSGQCLDRARNHSHAFGEERSTWKTGTQIIVVINAGGHGCYFIGIINCFDLYIFFPCFRNNQMCLDLFFAL